MLKKRTVGGIYSALVLAIAPASASAQTYSPDQTICRSTAGQLQPDVEKGSADMYARLGGPNARTAFYNTRILMCYEYRQSKNQATIEDWSLCKKALGQILEYQSQPDRPLSLDAFAKERLGLPTTASGWCLKPRP